MTKLLRLREWLSLADAAAYLEREFGEPVSDADVVRLGLDGQLKISVFFVNQGWARIGKAPHDEDVIDDCDQPAIAWEHRPQVIAGVWDLVLPGSGRIELEKLYQRLTGGPEVTLFSVGGLYLSEPDRRLWAEIVSLSIRDVVIETEIEVDLPGGRRGPLVTVDKKYHSTREIPEDALVVVRVAALDALTRSVRTNTGRSAVPILSAVSAPPTPPIQRQAAWDQAIVNKLTELGFDPLALPTPAPGKASKAKQAVREALSLTPDVMKKAWQRLLSAGRVKNA